MAFDWLRAEWKLGRSKLPVRSELIDGQLRADCREGGKVKSFISDSIKKAGKSKKDVLFFAFRFNKYYFCGKVVNNNNMVRTRNITDIYMMVLGSLSNNDKLELISKLSSSMREDLKADRFRPNLRTCFSGDWSDIVAEDLREAGYRGRTVEEW